MTIRKPCRPFLAAALVVPLFATVLLAAGDDFKAEPTWQPVAADAVRSQLEDYLDSASVPPDRQALVRAAWRSTRDENENDLLSRLVLCLSKADDRVGELVSFCAGVSERGTALPQFDWLADSDTPLVIRNNGRLYFSRWLVQQGYFDEALSWTEGLEPADVVAPEALLFYRAVALHQVVKADQSDSALSQLMERQENLPARYQKLADLMQHDLSGLKDESLDHIARRMSDIRRRLDQGRPGEPVQQIEKGVIESLDKLIKKAEDQMQQQQAQAAAGSGKSQPSTPMQDSRIAELKAPGKVDRREIGRGTGWGNLPEKDREKAMQEIGREFPSHYREVIEEYFRRLAAEESADKP